LEPDCVGSVPRRSDEDARQAPVPMILCILPALLVLVVGPGAIRISETLIVP
jgi:hypothetical protein